MISSKSDFIHIFNDFIHVYSPGTRAENPLGTNFDVNRTPLPLRPYVASFKQISLNSDFIHIFLMFFHIYIAPGQGQTTLCGQNSDVNRNALSPWATFIFNTNTSVGNPREQLTRNTDFIAPLKVRLFKISSVIQNGIYSNKVHRRAQIELFLAV